MRGNGCLGAVATATPGAEGLRHETQPYVLSARHETKERAGSLGLEPGDGTRCPCVPQEPSASSSLRADRHPHAVCCPEPDTALQGVPHAGLRASLGGTHLGNANPQQSAHSWPQCSPHGLKEVRPV